MARHQPDRKQRTGIIAMSDDEFTKAFEKGLAHHYARESLKAQRKLANAAEVNAGIRSPQSASSSGVFKWILIIGAGIGLWIYLDPTGFSHFLEDIIGMLQ